MGEQAAGRLWEWYGVQLPMLVVRSLHTRQAMLMERRLCLTKLGVVMEDDFAFLVLGVFWR